MHTYPYSRDKPLRVFFSAGEPSGDIHAANLIRQLQAQWPSVEAVGFGGPRMAQAGANLHIDLTQLAFMWFGRVVRHLPTFWNLVSWADRYFRHRRPEAVVLVDYPGLNWWIARRAQVHKIPVFYYAPPQIWAWARWRVRKMRRLVNLVLCALPFEAPWLQQHGCQAVYVGHPFFDELEQQKLDTGFLRSLQQQGRWVTILPGSRMQEVGANLPAFLKTAYLVHQAVPEVRFAVAAYRPDQAHLAYQQITAAGLPMPIQVYVGKTPELIALADCCLACSGSVSLELLYRAKPTVIHYRVGPLAYYIQQYFRKVKYITLVNLLAMEDPLHPPDLRPYDPSGPEADWVLFPEYLSYKDSSGQMAKHLIQWLTEPGLRAAWIRRLESLRKVVVQPGAANRSAQIILRYLESGDKTPLLDPIVPTPHFHLSSSPLKGDSACSAKSA
ncbi:MAG: lipid-A-disaccharide synthase [Thermoguttaceae bacterium]|nr:lipid-A-disaccharide synthase [Thermoguttaceae bacterium]MDW8038162.1 lipid-A-disaccharide synthase [Thermoguttaceae bacterium]